MAEALEQAAGSNQLRSQRWVTTWNDVVGRQEEELLAGSVVGQSSRWFEGGTC